MWWPNPRRTARLVALLALAGLTAGCFQPLYGDKTVGGGPGIADRMSGVDVAPIDAPNGTRLARVGVEVRNDLIFGLTGGGGAAASQYKLVIKLTSSQSQVIVDINTARPDIQNYGIDATYTLTDLAPARGRSRGKPSRACPTTFPASSSVSPATAACATPRTAPPSDRGQYPFAPGVVFRGGDVEISAVSTLPCRARRSRRSRATAITCR